MPRSSHAIVATCVSLSLTAFTATSDAQPGATPPAASTAPLDPAAAPPAQAQVEIEHRWYGWQILAADAAVIAAAFAIDDPAPVWALPVTGPLVHIANRRYGVAAGSLALRVGAPLVGLAIGATECDQDEDWDCLGTAVGGLLIGSIAAEVIDVALLAHSKRRVEKRRLVVPTVQVGPSSATVGLGFQF